MKKTKLFTKFFAILMITITLLSTTVFAYVGELVYSEKRWISASNYIPIWDIPNGQNRKITINHVTTDGTVTDVAFKILDSNYRTLQTVVCSTGNSVNATLPSGKCYIDALVTRGSSGNTFINIKEGHNQ